LQLNHVQTRVTTTPIVGVRDGWTRLALRAISRSEFSLKPAPETRVTHAVVVLADNKKPASESNAAILRRNAPLLAQLVKSGRRCIRGGAFVCYVWMRTRATL
jgi:hypothetical protein